MTRTWILAYWTVATLAVFRLLGHSERHPVESECGIRRTEYRLAILGFEWTKKVRETPMLLKDCGPAGEGGGR